MKPDVQRRRVEEFLAGTVSDYRYSSGSIFFQPGPGTPFRSKEFESHFMNLLKVKEPQPAFSTLDEDQFELCFLELLERPYLFESGSHGASLHAYYVINSWKICGAEIPTESALGVFFGAKPIVVPRFSFQTIEDFDYLKQALEDAQLCKLNPKHIKGRRS